MHRVRPITLLAALSLLALPALAAEIVTLTIDGNSPRPLGTGLFSGQDDRFLVQAEGAIKRVESGAFTDGWFDASGLGRLRRNGQILPESHFGVLLGTFTGLDQSFVIGDLASWFAVPEDEGAELKLILNMDDDDQADMQGVLKVHVIRYTDSESVSENFIFDANSDHVVNTGIAATDIDQLFLVIGQGAARVFPFIYPIDGWFDASGLGRLRRGGQIILDEPYGCLMASVTNSLNDGFFVGDLASWSPSSFGMNREILLGLNMSASDQANMAGSIVASVLRVDDMVVTSAAPGVIPDRDAILSVDNYPNPFNPMTTVRFELARRQMARAIILNVAGQAVRELAHGTFGPGQHELTWDGRDGSGREQASGTYLLRLETESAVESRKLTLVR